jgi:hypothetical protein
MKIKLDPRVSSPEDLQALILELREYLAWYGHVAIREKVAASHGGKPTNPPEQPPLSPVAELYIKSLGGVGQLDRNGLELLINSLDELSITAPQITITLAASPTGGLKKELVAWCRGNINPDVLVRFSFNRTLLGGMVIRVGSHMFDWSTRKLILEHRENIPAMLRKASGHPRLDAKPAKAAEPSK